jgi:hypothetical protein
MDYKTGIRTIKRIVVVLFVAIVLLGASTSCEKKEDLFLKGDIKVSEIITKNIFNAPLVIENDVDGCITINGIKVEFTRGVYELPDAGFFEMIIAGKDTLLFVLLDEERGNSELGLKKWVPRQPIITDDFKGNISLIYPKRFVKGIAIPVLFKIDNYDLKFSVNLMGVVLESHVFKIKNGFGTTQVQVNNNGEARFAIGNKHFEVKLDEAKTGFELPEVIDKIVEVPANSLVEIKNNLLIKETGKLVFNEGCLILISEAVNIINHGPIELAGAANNPILVTCSKNGTQFGGFISEGEQARIEASFTFFTAFAHHSSKNYQYGHAKHQALFKADNTNLKFTNCVFADTPGQVFYPNFCALNIDRCVVQRAKTSGQVNNSHLTITNSYFSDFPNDDQEFQDEDNDALYISASDAVIENSQFMYAKDDGIDSGGGEGGTIIIRDSRIEACFHEGIALSSNEPVVKRHHIINTIVSNCQQGIELGYSSSGHEVLIENCSIFNNYIGVRYGDNYEMIVNGLILIKNSTIFDNNIDIWNMVFQAWEPKPDRIIKE